MTFGRARNLIYAKYVLDPELITRVESYTYTSKCMTET